MPGKKLKNKNIRKLMRFGREGVSMGLTLPIEMVEKLKWVEHQKVEVELKGKHLIIKDWKE